MGVLHWEDKYPEHLALKTSRLNFGNHKGLWEIETLLLKGAYKISHAAGHRAKVSSDGSLGHTYLLVMEGPPERREATAHPGDTDISSMFSDINTVRLEINSKTKKKQTKPTNLTLKVTKERRNKIQS